jgi:hypothetical protein
LETTILPILDRPRSPLEFSLLSWACDNFSECVDAVERRWGDWDYERRCLGAIFRRRAAKDPGWMFDVALRSGREVLALSQYIGKVEVGGTAFPPFGRWKDWIRDLEDLT